MATAKRDLTNPSVQGHHADRDLLTLQEVARRLDVPEKTIYGWRYRGKGPKGHRVGKYVRYWWSDVVEWLEQGADGNLEY
jgi:excisionase family DNA binding protein